MAHGVSSRADRLLKAKRLLQDKLSHDLQPITACQHQDSITLCDLAAIRAQTRRDPRSVTGELSKRRRDGRQNLLAMLCQDVCHLFHLWFPASVKDRSTAAASNHHYLFPALEVFKDLFKRLLHLSNHRFPLLLCPLQSGDSAYGLLQLVGPSSIRRLVPRLVVSGDTLVEGHLTPPRAQGKRWRA